MGRHRVTYHVNHRVNLSRQLIASTYRVHLSRQLIASTYRARGPGHGHGRELPRARAPPTHRRQRHTVCPAVPRLPSVPHTQYQAVVLDRTRQYQTEPGSAGQDRVLTSLGSLGRCARKIA
eukprot:3466291-Rhodomonas_salina.1